MSVNGIEIQVGQDWKTAIGTEVRIESLTSRFCYEGLTYPVRARSHVRGQNLYYSLDGEIFQGKKDEYDLSELTGTSRVVPEPLTEPERTIGMHTDLAAPYGGQGADDFQVGVQFKQTEGGIPFDFAIDDEVTLNDHRVLNVHSIHGRGIERYYEGYNVEDGRNVHFTERDVVSFRPKGPLQPAEKAFAHVLIKVADTAATIRASAADAKTLEEFIAATADLPVGMLEQPISAPAILDAAAGHMRDRAALYDKPEGERSMGKTVQAFNIVTGAALTEAQGWLLLQLLKDVRLFQRAGFHRDSAEDCVAYAALKAEAKAKEVLA